MAEEAITRTFLPESVVPAMLAQVDGPNKRITWVRVSKREQRYDVMIRTYPHRERGYSTVMEAKFDRSVELADLVSGITGRAHWNYLDVSGRLVEALD